MNKDGLQLKVKRSTVIIFWLLVLAIFLGIYLFAPSVFERWQQTTYQNTPFVGTPQNP